MESLFDEYILSHTCSVAYHIDSDDFDTSSRTVILTAAEAHTTVCIAITDDNVLEDTQRFTVSLAADPTSGSQAGLVIGERDVATVEILEDPNDCKS